jgi:hypothetical protein
MMGQDRLDEHASTSKTELSSHTYKVYITNGIPATVWLVDIGDRKIADADVDGDKYDAFFRAISLFRPVFVIAVKTVRASVRLRVTHGRTD